MLKEFPNLRQQGEGFRRLFTDPQFDLYVWYASREGAVIGFQLVYKKKDQKRTT
jgi:hypothetical protein